MTYTPRRVIDVAIAESEAPAPVPRATFDPACGVHPDFEPARVRQRIDEAERLNRGATHARDRTLEVAYLVAQLRARRRPAGGIGPALCAILGAVLAVLMLAMVAG